MLKNNFSKILFALAIGLIISIITLLVFSNNPILAFYSFFIDPFSNLYFISRILTLAIPLAIAASGMALSNKAGVFNLGGEGEAYAGAFVFAIFVTPLFSSLSFLGLALAYVCALISGALLAYVSAFLKNTIKADLIITSFLLSQFICALIDYSISGPFTDTSSNLIGTKAIPVLAMIPKIDSTFQLSYAFIFAIIIPLILTMLLHFTHFGFKISVSGDAPQFALFSGTSLKKIHTFTLCLSGALYALGGALLVSIGFGRAGRGLSSGLGWNALAVALIAGNEPIGALFVAILFAFLDYGADNAMINAQLPQEVSLLIKASILLFVSAKRMPFSFLRTKKI